MGREKVQEIIKSRENGKVWNLEVNVENAAKQHNPAKLAQIFRLFPSIFPREFSRVENGLCQ